MAVRASLMVTQSVASITSPCCCPRASGMMEDAKFDDDGRETDVAESSPQLRFLGSFVFRQEDTPSHRSSVELEQSYEQCRAHPWRRVRPPDAGMASPTPLGTRQNNAVFRLQVRCSGISRQMNRQSSVVGAYEEYHLLLLVTRNTSCPRRRSG